MIIWAISAGVPAVPLHNLPKALATSLQPMAQSPVPVVQALGFSGGASLCLAGRWLWGGLGGVRPIRYQGPSAGTPRDPWNICDLLFADGSPGVH